MKLHIGTDHAGFEIKTKLTEYLTGQGHEVIDHGAFVYDETDDYPDFVKPVAHAVSVDPASRGIIIGGSGQGEAMCANRHQGARATVYYGCGVIPDLIRDPGYNDNTLDSSSGAGMTNTSNTQIVKISREHNNANILSLGARFITDDEAFSAVQAFLETEFSHDERHVRRLAKLSETIIE